MRLLRGAALFAAGVVVAAAARASSPAPPTAAAAAAAAAFAPAASESASASAPAVASAAPAPKPHIVFIFVDDYGYNNIGYHAASNNASAEILTPRLDELSAAGVKLERQYVFRFCSPTRSAFHTGRNPIHVNVLNSDLAAANVTDPISGFAGIPRNMSALPARLKEAGYRTVASGKWHVFVLTSAVDCGGGGGPRPHP